MAAEFRRLLSSQSDAQLLEPCLRTDLLPFVFEPNPGAWALFRNEVAVGLGVNPSEVIIVGSGRLGLSLTPGNNLRAFRDRSDIDVAIISATAFDRLWLGLLSAAYPRGRALTKVGGWLQDRKNEVYTGWLSPSDVLLDATIFGPRAVPVLDIRRQWFNVFKKASRLPPRRHADISYRLYRSWEHAEFYALDGLAALRKSMTT